MELFEEETEDQTLEWLAFIQQLQPVLPELTPRPAEDPWRLIIEQKATIAALVKPIKAPVELAEPEKPVAKLAEIKLEPYACTCGDCCLCLP